MLAKLANVNVCGLCQMQTSYRRFPGQVVSLVRDMQVILMRLFLWRGRRARVATEFQIEIAMLSLSACRVGCILNVTEGRI